MVLIRQQDYTVAYNRIHKWYRENNCAHVIVFVSSVECDSICALRILLKVFKNNNIQFHVNPIESYAELEDEAAQNGGLGNKAVVLVNIGGTEDIREVLGTDESTLIVIIDSRRPISHSYVPKSNENVMILCDEEDEANPIMEFEDLDEDFLGGDGDDGSDGDASGEDGDDDKENSESNSQNGRDGRARSAETAAGERRRPRKYQRDGGGGRMSASTADLRERRREYHQVLLEHYKKGTYFGKPAGMLALHLAQSLRMENKFLVWMGIVSLTDHYLHRRLTSEHYEVNCSEIEQIVHRVASGDSVQKVEVVDDDTRVAIADAEYISALQEFKFPLRRHWSLFESMLHSEYVAIRFQTWKEPGEQRLKLMLARMGIPLNECQQKYDHMGEASKRKFESLVPEYGHKEGLLELTYRSFVYVRGYTQEFGAADVALCVTALLETSDSAKESFWKAYEAVDVQNGEWGAFLDGITLAKKVIKAIVRQGSGALMKNIIKNKGKHLNVCHFEQSADSQLLAHPSPIERLVHFVQDGIRERGGGAKPLLGVMEFGENRSLLLGCHGPRTMADMGNKFSTAFIQTVESIERDPESDDIAQRGFSTVILEINRALEDRVCREIRSNLSSLR